MRFLLVFAVLAGCGKLPERPPVIDHVQMPDTATIGASGLYELSGLIAFHDDDNLVTKLKIHVPFVNQTYEYASTGLDRGTMALEVRFAATSPKGPMAYHVSLLDETNLESEVQKLSVTLQ